MRATKHLGLDEWVPHDLRRSVRTRLAKLGCPDEIGEAALGHVVGGIKGVYQMQRHEEAVGEWLERWAAHLGALDSNKVIGFKSKTRRRSA